MRSLRICVLFVFVALLCAVSGGGASGDSPAVVRVGILTSTTDAPLWIADKYGYFKDEGISVQFLTFNSGEAMIAPLSTGQLEPAAVRRRPASTTRSRARAPTALVAISAAIRPATASIR